MVKIMIKTDIKKLLILINSPIVENKEKLQVIKDTHFNAIFSTDIRRSSIGRQDITLKDIDGRRIGNVRYIPDTDKIRHHLYLSPLMIDIIDWLDCVNDIKSIVEFGNFWCSNINHSVQVKCRKTDGLSLIMSRLIDLDNAGEITLDDFKLGLRLCEWSITIDSRY